MSEIRVAVRSTISERSFGSIVSATVEEPGNIRFGQSVRFKANARVVIGCLPAAGDVWCVRGEILETEWGLQIEATRAVRELPTGRLVADFIVGQVAGVGRERANRLWRRWGLELGEVLSDERRLAEIASVLAPERPCLAPALAAACCRAWRDASGSTRTIHWLAAHGVENLRLSQRVIALFGDSAVEELEANPYVLVALLPWSKVDEMGLQLIRDAGAARPRSDVRRLVGAVDGAVLAAIRDGNTALLGSTLQAHLSKLLGVQPSSPLVALAITLGEAHGAILRDGITWRAPGCAEMEDSLCRGLQFLGGRTYPKTIEIPPDSELRRVLASKSISKHPMHREQQEAVLALLQRPIGCLQGGAGVGKTTTLQAVCEVWEDAGGSIVLCTIAGKAALRLSRATQRLAMTLARLLAQLRERERIEQDTTSGTGKEGDPRLRDLARLTPTSLVVVDEASMVDLPTAYELVQRLPPGARLLMVGDDAQLPPVGFGLVYHRLVSDASLTSTLTTVHRQSAESGIPSVAASIREGRLPALPPYAGKNEGVSLLAVSEPDLQNAVVKVWDELGARESGTLICTATKSGRAGINELNNLLQRRNADRTRLSAVKGFFAHWYCPGDPVVWLRNDYSRGLFNGLLGRVISVDPDRQGVTIQFDGYEQSHEVVAEELIDLALAYAITCHRAQGSQAPAVIVPLYQSRVLDPSWLYTAVTRAETQVVLVGDPAVMAAALACPSAARRRCVGLSWPP